MRWYPRSWRERNEEVVMGTLLDIADAEGRETPTRTEKGDLRRAGLAAHADLLLPGPVRDRVAAISLGAGTAIALALLTGQAWAPWETQAQPSEPVPDHVVVEVLIHPALWVLAAVAAAAGWTAASRALLVLTLPASVIAITSTEVSFLLRASFFTLATLAVLALLACVGRPAWRWQLAATALMGVAIASWLTFIGPFAGTYFPRGGLIDLIASPLPTAMFVLGTAVLAILRRRIDAVAVALAATPWMGILIGNALWLSSFAVEAGTVGRACAVVALAVDLPLAILLVARRYARPPWLSPSESSGSRTSASRPSSTR